MRTDKNSEALTLLQIEHNRIWQVLDVLEKQIELIEGDPPVDYSLVELIVSYFLTYPDTCHHPKEDLIFSKMLDHNPGKDGVVGDLINDHKQLSHLTHSVEQQLNSRHSKTLNDESIATCLKGFLSTYRNHIQTENRVFFPSVLKVLSQQELDTIDFDLFDRQDPVFDHRVEGQFTRLRDEIVMI